MVFPWSVNEKKPSHVSRIFLIILVDFDIAEVWNDLILPLTFKCYDEASFSPQRWLMGFYLSLGDRRSVQISMSLLSILAIWILLSSRWSPLVLWFLNLRVFIPSFWALFWTPLWQLVLSSPSYSIAFEDPWQGLRTYLSFYCLWFSLCGPPGRESLLFSWFSVIFLSITWSGLQGKIRWVVWNGEVWASHYSGQILGCVYTI